LAVAAGLSRMPRGPPFNLKGFNSMNIASSLERIATVEAAKLSGIQVVLPVKGSTFKDLLEATRKGTAHLSPKVWKQELLLSYCNQMSIDGIQQIISHSDATGLRCSAWIAFAKIAAVLVGTEDRGLLAWCCRSCELLAHTLNDRTPAIAETLQRVADDLKLHLGVANCACDTCVAVVGVRLAEAAIDAAPRDVDAWMPLVDDLRNNVAALIESIASAKPTVSTGPTDPKTEPRMFHPQCELN
jgi:hypothetical protein